jgi:hypothetical protein
MNDDVQPTSLRRIGAAAGGMFLLVLAFLAIQVARGHDPALGTTPKTRHVVARQVPVPVTAPPATSDDGQEQLPQAYGDDQGYQYEQPQQTYQDPQQAYQQPQYQAPPVQSTTS